jgi:hypothetical protein
MSDLMKQSVSHLGFAVELRGHSREVDGALSKVTESESAPSTVEGEGPVVKVVLNEHYIGECLDIGACHRTSLLFRAFV